MTPASIEGNEGYRFEESRIGNIAKKTLHRGLRVSECLKFSSSEGFDEEWTEHCCLLIVRRSLFTGEALSVFSAHSKFKVSGWFLTS